MPAATIPHLLIFVLGLVFLVKGSDTLVNAASTIAKKLGVSDFLIGLTLVAVGTSLPELASAVTSSFKGLSGLIVGNLMGANVANIGLIVGVSALLGTIKINEDMLERDGYIMMFIALLTAIFALNGIVSSVEGLFLLLVYFAYILFLLQTKSELQKKLHFKEFLKYFFKFQYLLTIRTHAVKAFTRTKVKPKTAKEKALTKTFKESLIKDFVFALLGGIALVLGARFVINEAVWFADYFGVSKTFIGLSVLALGTTLPEFTVSVNAIRKGFGELVMGNIIGSNIANLAFIFGIAAIINPVTVAISSITYLIPAVLIFSAVIILFLKFSWKVNHPEGIVLITSYILFILIMFFKG